MLLEIGLEHQLHLPLLFQKGFVDHGSMTNLNKNNEDVRQNLQLFLKFVDETDLYDIFVPTHREIGGGYKVNSNDSRLPRNIKAALHKGGLQIKNVCLLR